MKSLFSKIVFLIALSILIVTCQKDDVKPLEKPSEQIELRHDSSMPTSGEEKAALVALFEATDGYNWWISDNWMNGDPCMQSWYGVTCDQGKVIRLDLSWNDLTGSIPEQLGQLTNLQSLNLLGNQLTGPIPEQLGQLTNLQTLYLNGSQLSGPIPEQLGQLTNLQSLYLGNSQLSGPIPEQLGQLTNLQRLYLGSNQLSGPIPEQLGQLTNLQRLYLGSNQLSGPIPEQLGQLTNLEFLHLNQNQLSGPIPEQLGQLTNLEFLYLNQNQLSGPIPGQLGQLTHLRHLLLQNNLLECYEPGLAMLAEVGHPVFVNTDNNPGPDGNGLPEFQDFVDTGAGTCVTEPDDQVIELEEQLQDFIDNGWVDPNGSESLFNQLNQAFEALCEGNIQQAIQKLGVFITLVEAKMPNQIDPAHGQELIDAAQAIIDLLQSGEFEVNCE